MVKVEGLLEHVGYSEQWVTNMLSCSKNELLSLCLLSSSGHAPHSMGESLESIGCVSSSDTSVAVIAWKEGMIKKGELLSEKKSLGSFFRISVTYNTNMIAFYMYNMYA